MITERAMLMKISEKSQSAAVNKFRSNAGESISETLIALLISALALIMLAGAVTTASRIVTVSRDKLDEYYDNNEEIIAGTDVGHDSLGNGTVTITIKTKTGDNVLFKKEDVPYYSNAAFGENKKVVMYGRSGS